MNNSTRYNGYVPVYDWEHNGDYRYPAALLRAVDGVTISEYENNGDGNTAYIYFECTEASILPLLRNKDLESIKINFPFSKLLPEELTAGLLELPSKGSFIPATMTDDLHSSLSWEWSISYDSYLCNFESHQALFSHLADHKLLPDYFYRSEYCIYFYGTGTLEEQFEMDKSKMFGDLKYYFPQKCYTVQSLYSGSGWHKVISSNFVEIVYIPEREEKGRLTTRTILKTQKIERELQEIPEMLGYFFRNRRFLASYDLDFQGTMAEQFMVSTVAPEGLQFGSFSFPTVIQKVSCNEQKVELLSMDGKTYTYHAGNSSLADVLPVGETVLSEHDVYMAILYGLDIEYFFD